MLWLLINVNGVVVCLRTEVLTIIAVQNVSTKQKPQGVNPLNERGGCPKSLLSTDYTDFYELLFAKNQHIVFSQIENQC